MLVLGCPRSLLTASEEDEILPVAAELRMDGYLNRCVRDTWVEDWKRGNAPSPKDGGGRSEEEHGFRSIQVRRGLSVSHSTAHSSVHAFIHAFIRPVLHSVHDCHFRKMIRHRLLFVLTFQRRRAESGDFKMRWGCTCKYGTPRSPKDNTQTDEWKIPKLPMM